MSLRADNTCVGKKCIVIKESIMGTYDTPFDKFNSNRQTQNTSFGNTYETYRQAYSNIDSTDVLDYVDEHLEVSKYQINGQRTVAYMAEFFADVYFASLMNDKKNRCRELFMTMAYARSRIESVNDIRKKTAIVLLAHSDYESLEITLANYGERLKNTNYKLFVLQNGRGSYDCERTLATAQRYARLYPHHIKVIDNIPPQKPYHAIKDLLISDELDSYDYICKVDDDVFPLTNDWLDKLTQLFYEQVATTGERLGFVTGLINNNTYGFKKIIEADQNLADQYFSKYARDHICGVYEKKSPLYKHHYIVPAREIDSGMMGTIWGYPYIARFIHQELSLQPDKYVSLARRLSRDYLPSEVRYSIGCIMFDKISWSLIKMSRLERIYDWESPDSDEYLWHYYAKANHLVLPVDLSVPMVHIHFFSQRDENRDLIPAFQKVYQEWLQLPYPIAINADKATENENRLRYLESKLHPPLSQKIRETVRDTGRLVWKAIDILRQKVMIRTRLRRRGLI